MFPSQQSTRQYLNAAAGVSQQVFLRGKDEQITNELVQTGRPVMEIICGDVLMLDEGPHRCKISGYNENRTACRDAAQRLCLKGSIDANGWHLLWVIAY